MSKDGPRWAMLMAEHSMCQPGRPSPMVVDHDGSFGFGPFHSAKSRTSSLAYSSASTRSPTRSCSGSSRASRPYLGHDAIDVIGRSREHVGPRHPQGVGVGEEALEVAIGELADRDAGSGGPLDDL